VAQILPITVPVLLLLEEERPQFSRGQAGEYVERCSGERPTPHYAMHREPYQRACRPLLRTPRHGPPHRAAAATAPAYHGSAYEETIQVPGSPDPPTGSCDRWQVSACRHTRSPASEGVADTRSGGPRVEWAAAQRRRPPGPGRPVPQVVSQPHVIVVKDDTLPPVLQRIAQCESAGQQFTRDGQVLRGKRHPQDTGLFQINAVVWAKQAEALGYDIRTRDGNAYMARYIFDHYGSVPWQSSAKCWSRAN